MSSIADAQTRGLAADVTASEAASYAYCAKAWHLEYVLGKQVSRSASAGRDAGTEAHFLHGRRLVAFDRRVRWILGASVVVLAVGFALLLTGIFAIAR